jgi:hypothetical protein
MISTNNKTSGEIWEEGIELQIFTCKKMYDLEKYAKVAEGNPRLESAYAIMYEKFKADDVESSQAEVRHRIEVILLKELEPLMIGDVQYTYVIHQGKVDMIAEEIRKALDE